MKKDKNSPDADLGVIDYNTDLEDEIKKFKEEFYKFKAGTEEQIDTVNFLLKTYYVDYESNKCKSVLKDIQGISNELLAFVGNVCKEYGLEWWLDFGNLIGAVRHGDYVPWDDDLDIGMMREDYLEFDKIFSREVKKYGLEDIIDVGYRPRDFLRKNTIGTFIQIYVRHQTYNSGSNRPILGSVDIFPYDYIVDYDEETLDDVYLKAKNNYFHHKINRFNTYFCLDALYEDLNLTFEDTGLIIPGVEGSCGPDEIYDLIVFDKDTIFPLNEIKFGNYTFPCPNDVNCYLNSIYGDYLSIPKNLHRHNRVEWYKYNPNNDEVFNKCFNKIKKVNEMFE